MIKPYVIIAPHVDDEVIGCFSLLNEGLVSHVYFCYELTEERKEEAYHSSIAFGFKPVFLDGSSPDSNTNFPEGAILLVPNIADAHPDHKRINHIAKTRWSSKHEIQYYSVDMNVDYDVLDPNMRARKEGALKVLFTSQIKLFENEKYFLFESLMKSDSSKSIWVKFQREGIHCYPLALTEPSLADVSFLGHQHRHIFHFKVQIEVFHDDRDIEFIQFKRWCESLYATHLELNSKSCEMIADELSLQIQKKYPCRKLIIDVSEDNENGCSIKYGA